MLGLLLAPKTCRRRQFQPYMRMKYSVQRCQAHLQNVVGSVQQFDINDVREDVS